MRPVVTEPGHWLVALIVTGLGVGLAVLLAVALQALGVPRAVGFALAGIGLVLVGTAMVRRRRRRALGSFDLREPLVKEALGVAIFVAFVSAVAVFGEPVRPSNSGPVASIPTIPSLPPFTTPSLDPCASRSLPSLPITIPPFPGCTVPTQPR